MELLQKLGLRLCAQFRRLDLGCENGAFVVWLKKSEKSVCARVRVDVCERNKLMMDGKKQTNKNTNKKHKKKYKEKKKKTRKTKREKRV